MSAGALAAATTPRTRPFIFKVGGFDVTDSTPLDAYPVHISETTDGAAQMTWTIEDTRDRDFQLGAETLLTDHRSGSARTLFGGHLVNMRIRRRPAGPGRLIDCTAIGYDAWLDWLVVISWSSRNSKTGSTLNTDRKMVQQLVNKFGAMIDAPDGTVALTNSDMEVVTVKGVTLREALQKVADSAPYLDDAPGRQFYVDQDRRLHYFRDVQNKTAPYRIADGSYTRTVLDTTGLESLWPMREASGAPAYDANYAYHGAFAGGYQRGVAGGIPNEAHLSSTRLDGSTGYLLVSGSALHPGDTFSFECWYKRRSVGAGGMYLIDNNTGDFGVRFSATDKLVIRKIGTADVWVTDDSFTDTDDWHHLVATKDGSTRRVYVDGELQSGSGTNATIVAASGSSTHIGSDRAGGSNFDGQLQHAAIYSTALSAATVEAHYNQALSLAPESLVLELDASDGREEVYIAGKNDAGTGWVRPGSLPGVTVRTSFGRDEPKRQEIVSRQDSATANKKRSYGSAFLKRHNDPVVSGSFTVTDFDGWRVGQRVYVTDDAIGITNYPIEIVQMDTDLLLGNGTIKYDITLGQAPRTGMRVIGRSLPRKR